jgi:[ribosomal protein S5]-alanine N-acetyltransferase
MTSAPIVTPRLRLVTQSHELMRADCAADYVTLGDLLQANVPMEWPPEHVEPHCFAFTETMYAEHPHTYGWGRYIVLQAQPATLIGVVGAFPRNETEAEVGYGILSRWQRQGYATEATQALIAGLFEDTRIQTISAQTFPHLIASLRVMEHCGMHPAGLGDDAGTVRFRLTRPSPG